jgi:hypothetical protein
MANPDPSGEDLWAESRYPFYWLCSDAARNTAKGQVMATEMWSGTMTARPQMVVASG